MGRYGASESPQRHDAPTQAHDRRSRLTATTRAGTATPSRLCATPGQRARATLAVQVGLVINWPRADSAYQPPHKHGAESLDDMGKSKSHLSQALALGRLRRDEQIRVISVSHGTLD